MIPKLVISELIAVGNSGRPTVPSSLVDSERARHLLLCGWEDWKSVGARLEQLQLEALVKGLVYYSQASGFSGGSVSPVIPLYHAFIDRWPADEPRLTAWVVDNTSNPWEPFGTSVHGKARSQAELWLYHAHRRVIASENIEAEEQRARLAKVKRAARATENLYNAVRRGDVKALKALIEKGADWREAAKSKGSLLQLAMEKGRVHVVEYLKSVGFE